MAPSCAGRWFGCLGSATLVPIVSNELCERWCFYSVRAVLVLWLTERLALSDDDAVGVYSYWMAASYFSPLIGGLLSDAFLGRFRTILIFNVLYMSGLLVLAGTSFVDSLPGAYIGLLLIAIGTGGIKPCVAALGADQLQDASEKAIQRFFFVFYFCINGGAFLSYVVTPIVRVEFGFPWAFVLSLCLLVLSLILFLAGGSYYKKLPPVGFSLSVYAKFTRVLGAALKAPRLSEGGGFVPSGSGSERTPLMLPRELSAVHHYAGSSPLPPSIAYPASGVAVHDGGKSARTVASSSQLGEYSVLQADGGGAAGPPAAGAEDGALPLLASSAAAAAGEAAAGPDGAAVARSFGPPLRTGWRFLDGAFATQPAADVLGVAAVLRLLPIFLCLCLFWAVFDAQGSVWTLQRARMAPLCVGGACMTTEQLGALNPLFVLLFVPLCDVLLFPALRRCADASSSSGSGAWGWLQPTPLRRMSLGMFIAAASFVLTALVQAQIDASDAGSVSQAWQVPQYAVITFAEVLVSATGSEWAYSQAPPSMKASVSSLYLATVGVGNLITGVLYTGLASTLSTLNIIILLTALLTAASVAFVVLALRYRTLATGEALPGAAGDVETSTVGGGAAGAEGGGDKAAAGAGSFKPPPARMNSNAVLAAAVLAAAAASSRRSSGMGASIEESGESASEDEDGGATTWQADGDSDARVHAAVAVGQAAAAGEAQSGAAAGRTEVDDAALWRKERQQQQQHLSTPLPPPPPALLVGGPRGHESAILFSPGDVSLQLVSAPGATGLHGGGGGSSTGLLLSVESGIGLVAAAAARTLGISTAGSGRSLTGASQGGGVEEAASGGSTSRLFAADAVAPPPTDGVSLGPLLSSPPQASTAAETADSGGFEGDQSVYDE